MPRRGAISTWKVSCKSSGPRGNAPRVTSSIRRGRTRALFNAFASSQVRRRTALALARLRQTDVERSDARSTNVRRVKVTQWPETAFAAQTGALDLALLLLFLLFSTNKK